MGQGVIRDTSTGRGWQGELPECAMAHPSTCPQLLRRERRVAWLSEQSCPRGLQDPGSGSVPPRCGGEWKSILPREPLSRDHCRPLTPSRIPASCPCCPGFQTQVRHLRATHKPSTQPHFPVTVSNRRPEDWRFWRGLFRIRDPETCMLPGRKGGRACLSHPSGCLLTILPTLSCCSRFARG